MDNQEVTDLLQSIRDLMAWGISFQVIIMCILLVLVFFTGMKAGKGR